MVKFKPGDRVRRKKDFSNHDPWSYDPNKIYIVLAHNTRYVDDLTIIKPSDPWWREHTGDGWDGYKFELVGKSNVSNKPSWM